MASIAKALRLPPETVFRKAGLLPASPDQNELLDQLSHVAADLSDEDKQELIEIARLKLDRKNKRG